MASPCPLLGGRGPPHSALVARPPLGASQSAQPLPLSWEGLPRPQQNRWPRRMEAGVSPASGEELGRRRHTVTFSSAKHVSLVWRQPLPQMSIKPCTENKQDREQIGKDR